MIRHLSDYLHYRRQGLSRSKALQVSSQGRDYTRCLYVMLALLSVAATASLGYTYLEALELRASLDAAERSMVALLNGGAVKTDSKEFLVCSTERLM